MKLIESRLYHVGIYARLSKYNDSNTLTKPHPLQTSASIGNQVYLLTEYVKKEGWSLTQVYQDDGYSGGHFQRPAFQQMIEDAKRGAINLIIVKDLSRFGRDAVGVGKYTEEILPGIGCRFVSLNEGIDTLLDDNELMPFYSIMHDFYLKDLSKKIKKSLHQRAKDGKCLLGYTPYGYQKAEDDKNQLVIDEYAAQVVKRIFASRLEGRGFAAIARELNENGILPPRIYWNKMNGKSDKDGSFKLWREDTIKAIVASDIYTGRLTQMKTGTLSYKTKKKMKKSEDNWIITENAHEPIMDQETWEKVQEVNLKTSKTQSKPQISLFSAMLYCPACGSSLTCNTQTHKRKNGEVRKYKSYHCPLYYQTGRAVCSTHTIYEIGLIKIVQEDLIKQAEKIKTDEKALRKSLHKRLSSELTIIKEIEKQIFDCNKTIAVCRKKEVLYFEERMSSKISEDSFQQLMEGLQRKQTEEQRRLEKLQKQQDDIQMKFMDVDKWMKLVRTYTKLKTMDREFLEALIEKIEIGERQVIDGEKYQDIKIIHKFAGNISG